MKITYSSSTLKQASRYPQPLNGKADSGGNKITVNELKIFMEERVPELNDQYGGQAQYPTGFVHGNDFPISLFSED
ncbi:hypothetical protein JMN32_01625 [Fulvivirga sp. 29W222]|uniref:Uncharacterized protein n=1 Tax=Fulvivirga marina TaxID=2494733 RepID=A0A937FT52_9BACT|nr:hypothetical protein [Fulvivirga marina]MBL6444989.1 hypothetical protein [Fulvivirga marina]